ncbi:MAG: DUF1273 domain-containing protein [Apilactobacillus sp.]|uniref:DUF1273 domain-containing protein n=1 Tax=Apilactobacillus TaxID=2767877 RepID=UPI0025EF2ED3|nr:DUF1273 domain-containing protein [Apilactobacillus sp.]MCT6822317.1 DUF1273 domain-containing protein [Apilactobacillus sp.]MCT6857659.1 DUF1273 domain-containing protein [Apilactobacillus sp.]
MSRVWITGYRSYELGVFGNKDPKELVIKSVIENNIKQEVIDGADWIITGGQMGVEQWTAEVATSLKEELPGEFQLSVMLPFKEFGNQWNEQNQARLSSILSNVDFSASVSNDPYKSPMQLRAYQEFMLTHTDKAILIYDVDNPGKTQYDYEQIKRFSEQNDYGYRLVDFDELQEAANEYQNNLNNSDD